MIFVDYNVTASTLNDYDYDDYGEFTNDVWNPIYNGKCSIMVRFRDAGEFIKFKEYVLKTNWLPDRIPEQMTLEYEFHNVDQLEMLTTKIAHLLELGFNVYSANWKLATEATPIIERKEECE